MGKGTDREVEVEYSASGFASRLRRLADALEQGNRFTIRIKGVRVTVPPGAELTIEHEREGNEEELELGVKWTRE